MKTYYLVLMHRAQGVCSGGYERYLLSRHYTINISMDRVKIDPASEERNPALQPKEHADHVYN
jgi:hypothetical protein